MTAPLFQRTNEPINRNAIRTPPIPREPTTMLHFETKYANEIRVALAVAGIVVGVLVSRGVIGADIATAFASVAGLLVGTAGAQLTAPKS